MLVEGTWFLTPISTQLFVSREVDTSASLRSWHIEAAPEKMEKDRFAMLLDSTCSQSKLPLKNIAGPSLVLQDVQRKKKRK